MNQYETASKVVLDLSLKAAKDANGAILRTARLGSSPYEQGLIHIFAMAILQAEHEAVMEAMGDKEPFKSAVKAAEKLAATVKEQKRKTLKVVLPLANELIRGLKL